MTDRPRVDILNFSFYDRDGERVLAGGAERYVLELARVIGAIGAQPQIIQNANRYFYNVYRDVPVLGVPASSSMDLFAMSAGFSEAVKGAALVIASPLELASNLVCDAPIVGINHGVHWDYPNNRGDLHDPQLDRRIVDAVRRCVACVSVDANFYNWLRCFDADAAARVHVVPNFVDLQRFVPREKRFEDERLRLLFPRRLCVERGFRILVEAFDTLLPRYPRLELQVCGTGPTEDEAIARAFVSRHPRQVRWAQPDMDAIPAFYAASHVVLVPTVAAEGTSLSCIEAMATCNAIITTPVGGLSNLVIDGYNGIVAAPTVNGLVEAVERLHDDRALARRVATAALSVVPAFARERWAARWSSLLSDLIPQLVDPARRQSDHDRLYARVAWAHGVEAERDAALLRAQASEEDVRVARAAQAFAEAEVAWRDDELRGIKSSTGWAVLSVLYRIRFALFPRGSRREAAAKALMHGARRLLSMLRGASQSTTSASDEHTAASQTPAQPDASLHLRTIRPPTIVCLPILEWGFRMQRPQQLARQFARRGHGVLFAKHSFGARLSARAIEPGIEEVELPGPAGANPYRDALHADDADRMANALLDALSRRGDARFICIVQLPFWAGVAERLRDVSGCDVIYDCMDFHAGFSSNSAAALADERRLIERSDLVVCSSQNLFDAIAPQSRAAALVRNGVEYEAFAPVGAAPLPVEGVMTVGYYGAIADWFDSALVAEIARLRPRWRVVLVGSTWSADTAPLEARPNIELTGEKPYGELPAIIAGWHCCLIPFKRTPLTDATNPVKVYEMLAAGKPVVSVGLPEIEPLREAGLVAVAETASAFVTAIEMQVAEDDERARAARRAFAAANTWDVRADAIATAIDALEPEVSVIVVTFNNRDLNELCLASLFHDTDYARFEVIVVDNASKDGTPELLRSLAASQPRLRIVLNDDNLGFAAANNQGAAMARGRYLCFLNNDTVVHGAWLRTLIGHLRRHGGLGLVGPVTNAIGNEAKIPVGYADLAGMPAWADAHCEANRGRLTDISMLAFFCVAVPRWVWHVVGPLDERFGAGMFEDDDYNRRVRAAGFDVGLAWDSFVHHWQRASFKLLGDDEYLRIYRENQARYASKWGADADAADPLAALRRTASRARGTIVFAPSVGWSIPLAQRPHHIARVLAADGYAVVFDCSNAADPVDVAREVEPGLFLYKGPPAALADLPQLVLWTFSYNYDYRDAFPPSTRVVYDWIDDLSVFPYDQRKLAAMHERALREADVVASVARRLHERAHAERDDAVYAPNAVESGRFEREPDPNPALRDPAFAAILAEGRPIAGYYGALANWFDYALVEATARLRPDWSFVLIGPDHDGSLARSGLDKLRNVHALGTRAYATLPGYLHRFDVATIPFLVNDITLATSPLKLYEYFAAMRPVVSSPMPECAAFDVVRIVADADAFSQALDAARTQGRDHAFRAKLSAIAEANTWTARTREIMRVLHAKGFGEFPASEAVTAGTPSGLPEVLANKPFLEGQCNVCGLSARFFRDAPELDRESLTCEHCRTTSRYRSIARGVLRAIEARTGIAAGAIADLPEHAPGVAFRVYDTQPPFAYDVCAYPIPAMLKRCSWITVDVSSYRPEVAAGADLGEGIVNQNLEQLTYADETFDLVVTSDVMEHVRLDARAHAQIHRVLKPGGVYVFTVPHFRDRHDTLVRVRVHDEADPSRDEFVTEPEYHGDANAPGGQGVLSYRSYGTVLDEELEALGFDVSYTGTPDDEHGIRNAELFYCVKRRR